MKRRATLKDVARVAGVHLSTVSRALNPRTQHLLTRKVVEQIRMISRDLEYRPNAAAHSLRTNRTRTIGVVVPDITNPVFPPIIRGIEDALAKRGYVAILANTDGHIRHEAEIADLLRARGVDGLILASVEREDEAVSRLAAEGLPIVTVNRRVDDPAVSSVVNDENAGIRRRASSPCVARPSRGRQHRWPAGVVHRRRAIPGVRDSPPRTRAQQGRRARRVCGGVQRGGGLPAHRGITALEGSGLYGDCMRQRSSRNRRARSSSPAWARLPR